MLFDLQSTRRRRTAVKIIYSVLALLMVGGLVFLGVGTGNSNGGFANSLVNNNASGNSVQNAAVAKELKKAQAGVEANPNSAAAWAAMVNALYDVASTGKNYTSDESTGTGSYTASGKAALKKVIPAYTKYSALEKGVPDEQVAVEVANASQQTGDFATATLAWQDYIQNAPSNLRGYECLALAAYASKKGSSLGGQAATKAVALTPKLQRLQTQEIFKDAKSSQADAKAASVAECG